MLLFVLLLVVSNFLWVFWFVTFSGFRHHIFKLVFMLVLYTYMYNVTIHVHLVLTCTSGLTLVLYFSTHLLLPLLTGLFHIQHVFSLILNNKKTKNKNQKQNTKSRNAICTARRSVSAHIGSITSCFT